MVLAVPKWVPDGCYAAYDFCNRRWYNGYVDEKPTSQDKGSSASNGGAYIATCYTPKHNGVFLAGGTSQNRITDLGFFTERASTNYCLQSRDLTQAVWNTVTNATVLKDQVGNDTTSIAAGSSTASSILATGTDAIVTQTVTPVSRIYTATIAVAGTGYVANEVVTLSTATGTATIVGKIKVLTVSGGVPQTIAVSVVGGYTALPTNPVAQGSTTGSGVGLTVNLTFESFVFSACIKRLLGTGSIFMTTDGSTFYDVTSQLTTTGYTWITGMSQTFGTSTYTVGFKIATSADKIGVDFCQFEPVTAANGAIPILQAPTGGMPTTPLPAAGSSIARTNETAYWEISGIGVGNDGQRIVQDVFSYGGPWSFVASFNGDLVGGGPFFIGSDMISPAGLKCGGGTQGFGVGLTNKTTNFANVGRGNWNIGAFTCNGLGTIACLNGGAPSTNNTGTTNLPSFNASCTHFNLFNNGSGSTDAYLNGSYGFVYFFRKELTPAELQLLTDLNGPYATFNH